MRRNIFFLFLLLCCSIIYSNPIAVVSSENNFNYIRGTMCEPIFSDYQINRSGILRIGYESRFLFIKNENTSDISNVFSHYFDINLSLKAIDIGIRIPYIIYFRSSSVYRSFLLTGNLSDLLIYTHFEPFRNNTSRYRFNLGLGIKFPTGKDKDETLYSTSTETTDLILLSNLSYTSGKSNSNLHVGYSITGKTTQGFNITNHSTEYDLGNVLDLCWDYNYQIKNNITTCFEVELIGMESSIYHDDGLFFLLISPSLNMKFPNQNINYELGFSISPLFIHVYQGITLFARFSYSPKIF